MITPAPTSSIDPTLARGVFNGMAAANGMRDECVRLGVLGTSYDLHLVPAGVVRAEIGKRLVGVIRAGARRIDVVKTGGRYVEPVIGRPRRIQGSVISIDTERNAIVVDASVPIHCELTDERQKAEQFAVGQFVSFDALDGATFTPSK